MNSKTFVADYAVFLCCITAKRSHFFQNWIFRLSHVLIKLNIIKYVLMLTHLASLTNQIKECVRVTLTDK